MEETLDENVKTITWVTNPPERKEDISVLMSISGDTQPLFELFQVQIGEKSEVEVLEKVTNVERELLSFSSSFPF